MRQSFSTSEVAEYCHVTPDTIRKWAEAGRLVVFKTPGGHRRIRREDLVRFLRQNQMPVPQELLGTVMPVLVVSLDPVVLNQVRETFAPSGSSFQILLASDAYETGRLVAVTKPRVVIVDLQSVGEHGPRLCRSIAASPESAHACLIAVTRADDGQVGAQAIEMGAAAFLRKPINAKELRELLAQGGLSLNP